MIDVTTGGHTAFIATVQLLLDVENDAEAFDAVNEILRGQQREYLDESCLVDYSVSHDLADFELADDYEEGDMFCEPCAGQAPPVLGPDVEYSPDEDEIAGHLARKLEDGNMRLEDVPSLLARYGLMSPKDFVGEMAERMGRQVMQPPFGEIK